MVVFFVSAPQQHPNNATDPQRNNLPVDPQRHNNPPADPDPFSALRQLSQPTDLASALFGRGEGREQYLRHLHGILGDPLSPSVRKTSKRFLRFAMNLGTIFGDQVVGSSAMTCW